MEPGGYGQFPFKKYSFLRLPLQRSIGLFNDYLSFLIHRVDMYIFYNYRGPGPTEVS